LTVRIGTSGWVYNHWRGIYYPEKVRQEDWLAYYVRDFDTVEINNSFYRLPSPGAFDSWREQAPSGFLYALKASRFLTHLKKLKDPEDPLRKFFLNASLLGTNLGPVLYQLPPHWRVNLPRFEHFLKSLPKGFMHVVEFRDPSWLNEDVFRMMEAEHVSHCIHDMYGISVPHRITTSLVYVRLHGGSEKGGGYPLSALKEWAEILSSWNHNGLDVFVYFNNDTGGHAFRNAKTLKEMLRV
jgi:uncharacterized protein YecE (DUF72 family)